MPGISAMEYALKLLSFRARTKKELREKLASHNYEPEIIDAVLAKLEKVKFIGDEKLAESYARDKLTISRRGPRRIYFELLKRGVSKEIADTATKAINKDEELATARSVLASKSRQWARLDPVAKKRRAIGLLSRRGFSSGVLSRILKEKDWDLPD